MTEIKVFKYRKFATDKLEVETYFYAETTAEALAEFMKSKYKFHMIKITEQIEDYEPKKMLTSWELASEERWH